MNSIFAKPRTRNVSFCFMATCLLAASITLHADEPEAFERWYFNVDQNRLALDGYDPVSYFSKKGPTKGNADLSVQYQGITYCFSDEKSRDIFRKRPEKYIPQFGGWCAFLMSRTVEFDRSPPARIPSDPSNFSVIDGKLFLFATANGTDLQELWGKDAENRIERASKFWKTRTEIGSKIGNKPKGLNRLARMETAQFDFLIGEWDSNYRVRVSKSQPGRATVQGRWKAWYGWDGFAVYDDWKQVGSLNGNSGPAIRSFDPFNQHWVMHYIPLNSPIETVWQMTGKFNDQGELHATMKGSDGGSSSFLQRVHFVDIKPNSFTWRSDRSYDEGKTWIKDWGIGKNTRIVDDSMKEKTTQHAKPDAEKISN